jgi:hypothetical protein
LWKHGLRGLGGIGHSKYSNAVHVANDGKVIKVYGKESAGNYLEYVDAKTGKTVGHKIFEKK